MENQFHTHIPEKTLELNYFQRLESYLAGKTGYPFIDAGIEQIKIEGWCHHVVRNAVSMFLTRGKQ